MSEERIIKQTSSVIIKNLNGGEALAYLPNKITDNQLYELEILSTFGMRDIKYMEAIIYNEDRQEFVLNGNVSIEFSNNVIQSYYDKKTENITNGQRKI